MPDLDLGKYAGFIWPAYAITATVFAVMIGASLHHARRWRARAEALSAQASNTQGTHK
jgi:heme exporter protein D